MTGPDDPQVADLAQLTRISLDTDHPICQVCGQPLHEGDDITGYAYRAAGESAYAIGYIMCESDIHEHPTVFTRGVREYVVTGYVGASTNNQTQSETVVLLDPTVVVTSSKTTSEPHIHRNAPTPREPTQTTHWDPPSLLTAVLERVRSDGGAPHDRPK